MEAGGTTVDIFWADEGIDDADVQATLSQDIEARIGTIATTDGKTTVTWTNEAS